MEHNAPASITCATASGLLSQLAEQGFTESFYLSNGSLFCIKYPGWSCPAHYADWETFLDRTAGKWVFAISYGDMKGTLSTEVPASA